MQLFPHHAQLSKSLCGVILGPISFMEHEKTKQFDAFYWVQSKQVMKMLQWHSCRPCPIANLPFLKDFFFSLDTIFLEPNKSDKGTAEEKKDTTLNCRLIILINSIQCPAMPHTAVMFFFSSLCLQILTMAAAAGKNDFISSVQTWDSFYNFSNSNKNCPWTQNFKLTTIHGHGARASRIF